MIKWILRRLMCGADLHPLYKEIPSERGGRSTRRECEICGHKQKWHFGIAREFGQIVWVDED